MFRLLEISIIVLLSPIILFILIFISILLFYETKGRIIYFSQRIGINSKIFNMPKFRTMRLGTPQVATHLLENPHSHLTFLGKFLRKTSLDELPQVFTILYGDMSLVGPRPALFNQHDLIEKRKAMGVDKIKPGITGWAQINGRDDITIDEKIKLDYYYLNKKSILLDVKIIFLTILRIFKPKNISH
mgnify:CR=1 FL=1